MKNLTGTQSFAAQPKFSWHSRRLCLQRACGCLGAARGGSAREGDPATPRAEDARDLGQADLGHLGAVLSARASSPRFWEAGAGSNLHFTRRKWDLGMQRPPHHVSLPGSHAMLPLG